MLLQILFLAVCGLINLTNGSGVFYVPPAHACPEQQILIHPCRCTGESDEGIDLTCENTNIASMAIGLSQVKTKVKTLTVSDCNIEKLYGDVFRSLEVTQIIIKDTPVIEISNDTFIQVGENLERLEIYNSRLETFPSGAFSHTPNIETLIIDNSDITEIPKDAVFGLSKLKDLQISNAKISQTTKESFKGQRNLKRLSLHGNNLTKLANGALDFGLSLEYLDLAHNHLADINPKYFVRLGKLLFLNLTDNGIETINTRAFNRNQLLVVLHMGSNKITRIETNSFRGMRFMRRLYFENNQISYIGRQAFRSVGRIGGIYLSGNQLKSIDYQTFHELQFIDTIDVSKNQISQVSKESFTGLYLASINMSYNQIVEIPDYTFKRCDNISLDLSYNNITYIAEEGFDETSYAFILNISHNALTNMSQVPMTYQKGITVLDVSYNQIEDIPKGTFPKLYELHTIIMKHNNLKSIYRGVFSPLYSLRHLDFSYNSLEKIESSSLGKLVTLLDLDLSHNQISSVRRGAFGGLSGVRTIDVSYNLLNEIPRPPISLNHYNLAHNKLKEIRGRQPWPVMNSLISLDFDYNEYGDNLGPGRFNNLNTVQYLSLRYNNISKPPYESIGALQSLRVLNLEGNVIEKLEKRAFGKLNILADLDLSGNKLNNITVGAFEGLLQIVNITLRENNLTYIPPGAFKSLVALRNLDLSHNRLEKLENKTHGLLEDCLSIRSIDLSYNNIPFVTELMFPENRWIPYRLEKIDLSFNTMPVITRGLLHGTKHVKHLNLSHNILNDIRNDVLGNMTSLKVLDLSYNKLQDGAVRNDRWGAPLRNLTFLSLAHNKLYNIPSKYFAKFTNLKVLDVRGNDLIHFYPVFSKLIIGGLDVRYEGNILRCECSIRPLIHWIRTGNRKTSWDDTVCQSPAYLSGRSVSSVREEHLICDNEDEQDDFEISPDIKFRNIDEKRTKLALTWFVNTNEDVGDFRLELASLRGNKPRTLLVKDIGYNTRYDVLDQIPPGEELRMCLLVKTSLGRIRRWRKDQHCQEVGPFYSNGNLVKTSASLLFALIVLCLNY